MLAPECFESCSIDFDSIELRLSVDFRQWGNGGFTKSRTVGSSGRASKGHATTNKELQLPLFPSSGIEFRYKPDRVLGGLMEPPDVDVPHAG